MYNTNKKRGETKLNERLKKLRKTLDLTQQEFADKVGTPRDNIGGYETGRRKPSDAVISLICKTNFPPKGKVNENWLRTGEGDMFTEMSRDEQISNFVGELLKGEEDSFKRRFISMLAALDESDWESLKKMVELLQEKRD
jgi:transcriptional regulator with XRE-family HTH domain